MRRSRVVFLDRDGTLMHDRPGHFLTAPGKMRFYKNTFAALKLLKSGGFKMVVLSNQSGLARGLLDEKTLEAIHRRMFSELKKRDLRLTAVYYCPHGPQDRCGCRKPKTALIRRAVRDHPLTLKGSFIIGDKRADVDLGRNLGIPAVFLKTGHGSSQMRKYGRRLKASFVARDILQAARWILNHQNQT